ncbi:helix-turn-helix transcriptional regulator [Corynebacterium sp. A21]|uniref:helix-turn-helix transcriptional regulator n=1 Tax=Corynebacterium sp. A21 TaxID=3457318 RepID=UPI003FD4F5BA
MSKKSERLADLVRMLNLLPYFQSHPNRTIMEAARDLGRQPNEIKDDLNRLWCCGLPGHGPGDLVDLEADYQQVTIMDNQGMDKPLRLTQTEAGALLLTLESLENTPGLFNQEAVVSAAAKIRGIMGAETTAVFDSIGEDREEESQTLVLIRDAMQSGNQITFDYFSASRDSRSRRTVSPAHLFTHEGETYLTAWDSAADHHGAHRIFRVDRMRKLEISPEVSQPHARKLEFNAADPFNFAEVELQAELLIRPDATWLADYYPIELGESTDSGMVRATMTVGSVEWFLRFAMGQSDRVSLSGPENLRAVLLQRVESAVTAYDQPAGHNPEA